MSLSPENDVAASGRRAGRSPPAVLVAVILAAIILVAVVVTLFADSAPAAARPDESGPGAIAQLRVTDVAPKHDWQPELIDVMADYQRFVGKAWWAAEEGNWRLAAWYLRKVELAAARVLDGEIEPYAGYDAAALTRAFLVDAVARAQVSTDARMLDTFGTAYDAVLSGCNGCHIAMAHEYVVIVRPRGRPEVNQHFGTGPP